MPLPLPFSVADLKTDMLFGIPLTITDTDGNRITYPDTAIERCIRAAVNTFERELQIDLWKRKVYCRAAVTHPEEVQGTDFDIDEDPLDYNAGTYYAYGYFRLRRYPIISVEKLELRWPESTNIFTYPAEWLRVDRRAGQISIVAIAGGSQPVIVARQGGYLPMLTGGLVSQSVPQLIYCDYTSGLDFENEETRDQYQDLILNLQKQAAANVLQGVGRGIRPGVASESLSEDGQSESTSYARNKGSIYQAEIDSLTADVTAFLKSFKAFYKGPIFSVL